MLLDHTCLGSAMHRVKSHHTISAVSRLVVVWPLVAIERFLVRFRFGVCALVFTCPPLFAPLTDIIRVADIVNIYIFYTYTSRFVHSTNATRARLFACVCLCLCVCSYLWVYITDIMDVMWMSDYLHKHALESPLGSNGFEYRVRNTPVCQSSSECIVSF